MSEQTFSIARLTKEQREEIELLEMRACLALLDDQIVQLHRFKDFQSDMTQPLRGEVYSALMASVAYSTELACQMNARAQETLHERAALRSSRRNVEARPN